MSEDWQPRTPLRLQVGVRRRSSGGTGRSAGVLAGFARTGEAFSKPRCSRRREEADALEVEGIRLLTSAATPLRKGFEIPSDVGEKPDETALQRCKAAFAFALSLPRGSQPVFNDIDPD